LVQLFPVTNTHALLFTSKSWVRNGGRLVSVWDGADWTLNVAVLLGAPLLILTATL
jgi:hypothetical protein